MKLNVRQVENIEHRIQGQLWVQFTSHIHSQTNCQVTDIILIQAKAQVTRQFWLHNWDHVWYQVATPVVHQVRRLFQHQLQMSIASHIDRIRYKQSL